MNYIQEGEALQVLKLLKQNETIPLKKKINKLNIFKIKQTLLPS